MMSSVRKTKSNRQMYFCILAVFFVGYMALTGFFSYIKIKIQLSTLGGRVLKKQEYEIASRLAVQTDWQFKKEFPSFFHFCLFHTLPLYCSFMGLSWPFYFFGLLLHYDYLT